MCVICMRVCFFAMCAYLLTLLNIPQVRQQERDIARRLRATYVSHLEQERLQTLADIEVKLRKREKERKRERERERERQRDRETERKRDRETERQCVREGTYTYTISCQKLALVHSLKQPTNTQTHTHSHPHTHHLPQQSQREREYEQQRNTLDTQYHDALTHLGEGHLAAIALSQSARQRERVRRENEIRMKELAEKRGDDALKWLHDTRSKTTADVRSRSEAREHALLDARERTRALLERAVMASDRAAKMQQETAALTHAVLPAAMSKFASTYYHRGMEV